MAAQPEQFILFDFDGVIVDSYAPSFAYVRRYNPWLTDAGHRRLFEGNIHRAMAAGLVFGPDEEFWTYYQDRVLATPPIAGVVPAVRDLASRYRLLVISSSKSEPIREYLRRHGIADVWAEVWGGDIHRSKVEKMRMAFANYGTAAAHCLFVTDTLGDLREAAEAGVPAFGVLWGFHSWETLVRGNPAAIVAEPASLVAAIDRHFQSHGSAL